LTSFEGNGVYRTYGGEDMTGPQAEEHDVGGKTEEQDVGRQADERGEGAPVRDREESPPRLTGMTWFPGDERLLRHPGIRGELARLLRRINKTPPWWVSQIIVGGLISAAILITGTFINAASAKRDEQHADDQARHAVQLENLRFVRDRALTGKPPYPFASFDLRDQDLSRLQLPGADFRGANLSGADLSGADVSGCVCDGAVFSKAWLDSTKFSGATLTRAVFNGAMLEGALFNPPDAFDGSVESSELVNAQNAHFDNAYLVYAQFRKATLNGAHFSNAQLENADFGAASLFGANFSNANLLHATLNALDLDKADFTNAYLVGADFSLAHLENVKLDGIYYDTSTKWPAGFRPPVSQRKTVVSFSPRPSPPEH
jgi:uncharacterized protein YjbI with pentapeptide repeats